MGHMNTKLITWLVWLQIKFLMFQEAVEVRHVVEVVFVGHMTYNPPTQQVLAVHDGVLAVMWQPDLNEPITERRPAEYVVVRPETISVE